MLLLAFHVVETWPNWSTCFDCSCLVTSFYPGTCLFINLELIHLYWMTLSQPFSYWVLDGAFCELCFGYQIQTFMCNTHAVYTGMCIVCTGVIRSFECEPLYTHCCVYKWKWKIVSTLCCVRIWLLLILLVLHYSFAAHPQKHLQTLKVQSKR